MEVSEFERTLDDCEVRLDRLRALYEQYFQGLERLEPLIPKKELHRRVQLLRGNIPRNTRLRFRFQQLVSKYTTYQSYWMRVARQIEEGTYRRDIMKARRKREEAREARNAAATKKSAADGISIEVDLDSMDLEAEVAAASADAEAAVDRMFEKDDVLAAIDNLGPRSKAPPGGESGKSSLSPFAARPLTPLLTSPPRADKAERSQFADPPSKTFAKPAPPGAPGTAKQPKVPAPGAATGTQRKPPAPSGRTPAYRPPSPGASAAPRRPAVVKRRPSSPPGAKVVGGPDDEGMRRVYNRYVEARKRNNERVDNLRFESVKKSIQKQLPKLRQKHKGKKIDFEVVIRNGKVGLKPVPK
jgi:hypothetical protein